MSSRLTDFDVCASKPVAPGNGNSALYVRGVRCPRSPPLRCVEPASRPVRSLGNRSSIALAIVAGTAAIGAAALAEKYHSNPWLLSWIPAACCVTNDCCWEIQESELRPLPDDLWEVRSTGQVRRRTDWSPDGKFYRCACDYNGTTWIRHQGANTRCLFIPMRSAAR